MTEKKVAGDSKAAGVVKKIAGEAVEVIFTGGFIAIVQKLISSIVSSPEFKKTASEKVISIFAGGKTRADELVCYSSLVNVSSVSAEDKILFMTKHHEMLNPDLNGRTSEEKRALILGRERARGIVSLMAEDKSFSKTGSEQFFFASKTWHGIFLGINLCPDIPAKMDMLEKRIIHFGENITAGGVTKSIKEDLSEGAVTVTTACENMTNWLNSKFR